MKPISLQLSELHHDGQPHHWHYSFRQSKGLFYKINRSELNVTDASGMKSISKPFQGEFIYARTLSFDETICLESQPLSRRLQLLHEPHTLPLVFLLCCYLYVPMSLLLTNLLKKNSVRNAPPKKKFNLNKPVAHSVRPSWFEKCFP